MESMAAASKVATFLGKGEVTVSPEIAYLTAEKCNTCGVCVGLCPTKAITKETNKLSIASVSCIGCGACVSACPNGALGLKNTTEEQLTAQIEGLVEGADSGPKIIAFMEKMTAYGSADLGGQSRRNYSPSIRIIRVPSVARLGLNHVLRAFAAGADGIIFVEGDDSPFREDKVRDLVIKFKKDLGKYGIPPLRLQSATITLPQYEKMFTLFDDFVERIGKMTPITKEKRAELKKQLEGKAIGAKSA
jgi:heterodisulfide reductase subunit A